MRHCTWGWAILSGLTCATLAGAQPPVKPLRWGADAAGGAPYIFKDPDAPDRYLGFEVELKDALARELQRPIEFKQYEFKELTLGLERGDIDFAMNGIEITPDRQLRLRFSRPYYAYRLQLVTRRDETRFQDYPSLVAFRKATVGTLEDTAAERLLKKDGLTIKSYAEQTDPYQDLVIGGRVDAVLMDLPIAIYYVRNNEKFNKSLRFAGDSFDKGLYAIAFAKGNDALVRDFDAALDRLAKSGELRRIYLKWGLWNKDQEELFGLEGSPAFWQRLQQEIASQGMGQRDVLGETGRKQSFATYFPELLKGAGMTVVLTLGGFAVAVLLGLILALMRLYGSSLLQRLALIYIEFFRGVPVVLVLYFMYYGLGGIAKDLRLEYGWDLAFLNLDPLVAAILGFGLTYAAYEAEIYRAGITSIPEGQWEAAAALGMTPRQTFRRIILPQAFRVILPPMTNDFVALFKDTSIVAVITLVELSKKYQIEAKSGLNHVEIGLVTAALYLLMSLPLGHLSRYLEKKWGKQPR
jgi:polar amino acid transport system substrate-binding protein